jgi:hypothetical protein
MKKISIIALLAASLLAAAGCTVKVPLAMVKTDTQAKNEAIMTDELKALLAEKPRPKLVIRVSNPPANVTEAERFNAYINVIEKTFMENGFTIRDRALLENLLRAGNVDYESIGAKIDTDLIIDVLSLQFDIANPITVYQNLMTQQQESFLYPDNNVDCRLAKLECRLTIVKKGQLGGMFTYYVSRCDFQDIKFLVNRRQGLVKLDPPQGREWYRRINVPIEKEDLKAEIVKYMAKKLIGQLQVAGNRKLP